MISAYRAVSPLLLGIGIVVLGGGALNTLLPLLMQEKGLPAWSTGIVMSAYFCGAIAGPFACRPIILAIGHVRTFAAFVSLASVTVLAHPFLDGIASWMVLRFTYGFCVVCIYMVVESWINQRASNEVRGRVLSIYVVVIFLFQGAGQLLVNVPDPTGTALFALISALISLAAIPVLTSRMPQPDVPEANALNFRVLYRASPLGTIGIVFSGLILGAVLALGPIYATEIDLGTAEISVFMAAVFIGGLVFQWPAGTLSDRIGRRPVFIVLGIGLSITSVALASVEPGADPLFVSFLFGAFGAFYFVLYPMCVAITNDRLEPADLVAASGGLLILNNIGNAVGPLMAGILVSQLGAPALFWFCAIMGTSVIVLAIRRIRTGPETSAEAEGDFRAVPNLTPISAELDPRGSE